MLKNWISVLKTIAKGYATIIVLLLGGGLGFIGGGLLLFFGLPVLYLLISLPFMLIGVQLGVPDIPEWFIEIFIWICVAIGAVVMYQDVFDD